MRLAVISDIHGVLSALEAALEEISNEKVTGIIVAGDMVAGPHPGEVVNRLREVNSWMIRGNNENYLLDFHAGTAPYWWHMAHQWDFVRWNFEHMDKGTLDYINSLPEQRVISFSGKSTIRVVHGSVRNSSELIYPEKDISLLDLNLELVSEPVVIFGHTHMPWQMHHKGRLALNPGALSMSFTGKGCGSYALLTWEDEHWRAKLRYYNYDTTLARKDFEKTGLLENGGAIARSYLLAVQSGINTLPGLMAYAYKKAAQAGFANSPFIPDEIWDEAMDSFEQRYHRGVL